ncbi:hypothetical protein NST17_20645 [Caldifermentibacillus hisashii]|uniref:Uncharacterized protein n=1 Tax=Caldifermentibacillus hisashii TaxID=996558 RepID=A0ABU9K6C0_9BACI
MASWYKYAIFFAIFIVAFVTIASITLRQESNLAATQEVSPTMQSAKVGEARENATNALDKKALVANFIMETVKTHKHQGEEVTVDYVFLDKNGNVTENENDIESVQFKVNILDDGKIASTSEQRISLIKKEE